MPEPVALMAMAACGAGCASGCVAGIVAGLRMPRAPARAAPHNCKGDRPKVEKKRRSSSMFSMSEHRVLADKMVIVMVGLPARGKSYISKALMRHLNLMGVRCRLFNAGNSRRASGQASQDAHFFDSANVDAKMLRETLAMECLEDLLEFLRTADTATAVGIFDATNTTMERRSKVHKRIENEPGVRVMFLESICEDEAVLQLNYRLKLDNEDYKGMSTETALADFRQRVRMYEEVYETLQDTECGEPRSYIKLYDAGRKFIFNRCDTDARQTVTGHVLSLLHSIHLGRRSIFLALVGETENDRQGVLGGDSPLTKTGARYGRALDEFLSDREVESGIPALVMCGTLTRHLQLAEYLKVARKLGPVQMRAVLKMQRLNELCAGTFDSLSYEEMARMHPGEDTERKRDKLNYRYPGVGGESYVDLVARLQDIILRLEQLHGPALLLCDKAVCRVLLAYFRGTELKQMPYIEVAEGIVQLERAHSGFTEKHVDVIARYGEAIKQLI